jgi:AmmeMemoRadiSam system protein B
VIREPAVAGSFYPGTPAAVERALADLLPERARTAVPAVVVPHAAWGYSGVVAGDTYAQVSVPALAVLLGPNHAGRGAPGAVASAGAWRYPGGAVRVAAELSDALVAATSALQIDDRAHADEHALEVQLPFLARLRPDVRIAPVLLGRTDPGFCRRVGEALGRVVASWPAPILVVDSTDLNHYEPHAVTLAKDRHAIDALLTLDPDRLHAAVQRHRISMCGLAPTLALMWAAPALGIRAARLVRHQTSGDAGGDPGRVVGYAGFVLGG